jgi:hypothetical protein
MGAHYNKRNLRCNKRNPRYNKRNLRYVACRRMAKPYNKRNLRYNKRNLRYNKRNLRYNKRNLRYNKRNLHYNKRNLHYNKRNLRYVACRRMAKPYNKRNPQYNKRNRVKQFRQNWYYLDAKKRHAPKRCATNTSRQHCGTSSATRRQKRRWRLGLRAAPQPRCFYAVPSESASPRWHLRLSGPRDWLCGTVDLYPVNWSL